MKAAVVEKPGVLTLMDIPEPEITDPSGSTAVVSSRKRRYTSCPR